METHLNIEENIQSILGRKPDFEEVTHKGKEGFLPVYFNFTLRNSVSTLFGETKEESAKKFLKFLQNKQGDKNETGTGNQPSNDKEDSSPVSTDW